MRLTVPFVLAVVAALAASAPAAEKPADKPAEKKVKKPALEVRATPRMAFSPVNILLTAELTGGDDDAEEYYCPELEWDWDDGGKSVHEADCPEFEAGKSKIERRFTAEHAYNKAGMYNVKVTMRHSNRTIAASSVKITVRPGLGDRSMDVPGQ